MRRGAFHSVQPVRFEYFGLSERCVKPEEAALVEMKLNLARRRRDVRTNRGLSQAAMAKLLGSSQSRVAKMEAGDASVSVDLLVRSLLLVGASRAEIAREIGRRAA
jgi:DNA-binding XRE family transcriptional regulator